MATLRSVYFWILSALYGLDLSGGGTGYRQWKALLYVDGLALLALLTVDLWLVRLFAVSLFFRQPNVISFAVAVGVVALHHLAWPGERAWSDHLNYAKHLPGKQRTVRLVLAWAVVLGVLVAFALSFWLYSEWRAVRR